MLINGSAHQIPLRDKSVHSICTSPPYFGLRKYPGRQEVEWPAGRYSPCTGAPACIEVPEMRCGLGMEPTVEAYIWHMLLVLRECRRVLRDDGTLWLNLGDSFAGTGKSGGGKQGEQWEEEGLTHIGARGGKWKPAPSGLNQGDLIGIPHRVMLAAQADEWLIRNDCVWGKLTVMPESVRGWKWSRCRTKVKKGSIDRFGNQDHSLLSRTEVGKGEHHAKWEYCRGCEECSPNNGYVLRRGSWRHTRAHEYIFQLTKQMSYWADGEMVKERAIYAGDDRKGRANKDHKSMPDKIHNGIRPGEPTSNLAFRNPRSVITPSPSPYAGLHFATFPPDLIIGLILSSVPHRCCPECGQGWAPVVHQSVTFASGSGAAGRKPIGKTAGGQQTESGDYDIRMGPVVTSRVNGYRPTCDCGRSDYVPGILLDPFCGSGTSGAVARQCSVGFVGVDISFEYLNQQAMWRAERRISLEKIEKMPLFAGTK